MTDFEALREEIRHTRDRLDKFERRLDMAENAMQGDAAWKRKGVIDQVAELVTFVEAMKGFDFAEMKSFASEYKDFKKRILTIGAVLSGLTGGVWLIIANMEKIAKIFHH